MGLRKVDLTPRDKVRLSTYRPRGRELFPVTSVAGIYAVSADKVGAKAQAVRLWLELGYRAVDAEGDVLEGSDGRRYVLSTARMPDGTLVALIPEELKDDPRSRTAAGA